MNRKTAKHIQRIVTALTLLAILGLAGYAARRRGAHSESPVKASSSETSKAGHPPTIVVDDQATTTEPPAPDPVLRISPDKVLASINGHLLTAKDIFPPGPSNQDISLATCEYFRQRAVNRELIFQTAKAREVGLNESQQQQLANLQRLRRQQGPGLVRDLAGGPDSLSFELRDDEAFMLQTSLMEKSGASPDVTSQQVWDYYRQHLSDFGELPADESSRQETWSKIDFKIRQTLASSVRSDFQTKLAEYMKQLKSAANIELTPLTSFASQPQIQ